MMSFIVNCILIYTFMKKTYYLVNLQKNNAKQILKILTFGVIKTITCFLKIFKNSLVKYSNKINIKLSNFNNSSNNRKTFYSYME